MIEATDASKCDERHVKNKPKSLHKKKGARHIMSTQGMKTWKLGLFFVVSLMLVAGLFADTASAQTSTLEVTTIPPVVKAEEMLDEVIVTYTLTGTTPVSNQTVSIALPSTTSTYGAWAAAYANDGVPVLAGGSVGFGTLPTASGETIDLDGDSTASPAVPAVSEVSSQRDGVSSTISSYVTVRYTTTDSASDTTASATISSNTVQVNPDDMVAGDKIIVTFHNVKVGTLAIGAVNLMRESVDVSLEVDDDGVTQTPTDNAFAAEIIQVNPRKISTVEVSPSPIDADATKNITVTYIVEDHLSRDNTVAIELPSGWYPAYDTTGDPATVGDSSNNTTGTFGATATARLVGRTLTTQPTNPATGKTYSYIEVSSALGLAATATAAKYAPTITQFDSRGGGTKAKVELVPNSTTAPPKMKSGDRLTVTFFNVKVQTVYDQTPVQAQATVTDTGVTGPATKYNAMTVFTVQPPSPSVITVTPSSVDASGEIDLKVEYTVDDTLYNSNDIMIKLPRNWFPARPHKATETKNSFGDEVLAKAPSSSSDRAKTSYVVLTSSFRSTDTKITGHDPTATTPMFLRIDQPEYEASVTIPVTGGMEKGDKITVTFNNVRVEPLSATVPMDVALTVKDDIPGSAYDDVTIEVKPQKRGTVTVTPKDVFAESVVDLKVRYTARDTLAGPVDGNDTYGRIRVELPAGWGANDNIVVERPTGDPDATYVTLTGSSAVINTKPVLTPNLDADVWTIDIDVDKMTNRQQVTLTVHNLKIAELETPRRMRDTDITKVKDLVQVTVSSSSFDSSGRGIPTHSPKTVSPDIKAAKGGSDRQPTITVKRKILGEVDVSPKTVPAGSMQDFEITYTASEAMEKDNVIEITLPAGWPVPMAYSYNAETRKHEDADGNALTKDTGGPLVHLSGSRTRLTGTRIKVIDKDGFEVGVDDTPNPLIIQITVGTNGVSEKGKVVLEYKGVTVQRDLAKGDDKLVIKTFSGPMTSGLPQFPVKEQEKDNIEVIEAADGSGTVTFEYEDEDVTSVKGKDHAGNALVQNTTMSIPGGLTAGDLRELEVIYNPAGDMGTKGEFEFRLPSAWTFKDALVAGGGTKDDKKSSGNTVVVDLDNHFGEASGDDVTITFTDITVPNDHGVVGFSAKSTSSGTLEKLSAPAAAFVGNAEATHDTVGVKITPTDAYVNEEDVNFEIELTNTGPLHNSEIRITVPEGISGLHANDPKKSDEANYVRRISTTAMSVDLGTLDIIDEDIVVHTGKLNAAGKIRIGFYNVDLTDGVSTDNSNGTDATTGFRVVTRTRGSGDSLSLKKDKDDKDLDYYEFVDNDPDYEPIEKENGERSIVGGLIRTVEGSGVMEVEPMIVDQNSSNVTVTLTYTAKTDVTKKDLVIQMPSVIETVLQEDKPSVDGFCSYHYA